MDDNQANLHDLEQDDQSAAHILGQEMSADDSTSNLEQQSKSRTDKQRQTSTINGRKSHGPTSSMGKQRSAQNAVRDGIFSRQIVIAELGETQEDFDQLRAVVFDSIRPCDKTEELMAMDFTENWFLRDRVRRAEELERRNRLNTFRLENKLRRSDRLEQLKTCFVEHLRDHVAGWNHDYDALPAALEEARQGLMSMSEGVEFLLALLKELAWSVEAEGVLTVTQRALFQAIRGSGHPFDIGCRIERLSSYDVLLSSSTEVPPSGPKGAGLEAISDTEDEVPQTDEELGVEMDRLRKEGIATLINTVSESLQERQATLQQIEEAEIQKQIALIMLDPSSSDRFGRAETSRGRKINGALAGIMAIRNIRLSSPSSLPALVGLAQQKSLGALEEKLQNEPEKY